MDHQQISPPTNRSGVLAAKTSDVSAAQTVSPKARP